MSSTTKLFVGNLPEGCNNDELRKIFEAYGTVAEADMIRDYGFVHFDSVKEAKIAVDSLNESTVRGSTIRVQYSHSKVRQRAGMGDNKGCYKCGQDGHWSKDCPTGPTRPRYDRKRSDPYGPPPSRYAEPYDDYYRESRYPPHPYERSRAAAYADYYRRPAPPRDPYRDPYARERDPYARPPPEYYSAATTRAPPTRAPSDSYYDGYYERSYPSPRAPRY